MIPSAHDLLYFREIALTGNLSRASERLGVTQPSLSISLKRLEGSLGQNLFYRSRKGVALTPAGKQLLAHSQELLQKWDTVRHLASTSHTEVRGTYTIGCHPSVGIYTLGKILPRMLENYPDLQLKLKHDLSRKITESIIQLETDIGIVVNPVRHPDLVIKQLFSDTVAFWTTKNNRNSKILICDPDLLQSQALIRKIQKKQGIAFHRIISSSSLEVISQLAASGAGIAILPTRVAQALTGKTLHRLKDAPTFSDEICLVYRSENRSIRTIQVISDAILGSLK